VAGTVFIIGLILKRNYTYKGDIQIIVAWR